MTISHLVTSKIDYNPKRIIFFNWANFAILKSSGTHGEILYFEKSIIIQTVTKNFKNKHSNHKMRYNLIIDESII